MRRLITLIDFSPADFKWFLTVLADRRLFCYYRFVRTGLVTDSIVFRIWESLSRCWFGCVHSEAGWLLYNDSLSDVQSLWRKFLLTACRLFDIFAPPQLAFVPCSQRIIFFQNTRGMYPNLKRGHTEFWIMHGRHCLRTWCLDIVLSTRIITYSQWNTCLVNIKPMVTCYNSIYQRVLNLFLCVYMEVYVHQTHILLLRYNMIFPHNKQDKVTYYCWSSDEINL
jgi:hypothetical protein